MKSGSLEISQKLNALCAGGLQNKARTCKLSCQPGLILLKAT